MQRTCQNLRFGPRADTASNSAVPKVVYYRLLILGAGERERRLKCPILLLPRNREAVNRDDSLYAPQFSRYSDLRSPSSLLVYPMSLMLSRLGAADRAAE